MSEFDAADLEILYQAKKSENGITPEEISKEETFTQGVWELVDRFTVLQEKGLLSKNKGGRFELTKKGSDTFWHLESPLWLNLLRLLRVESLPDIECARYLDEPIPAVQQALEMISKKGYVMMSPLRRGEKLLKMYQILPEGVQQLGGGKKSKTSIVKPGDKLIVEVEEGEGIIYEIVDDLVNPLRMVKTLSKTEIDEFR